jgi:hypothetical protein
VGHSLLLLFVFYYFMGVILCNETSFYVLMNYFVKCCVISYNSFSILY